MQFYIFMNITKEITFKQRYISLVKYFIILFIFLFHVFLILCALCLFLHPQIFHKWLNDRSLLIDLQIYLLKIYSPSCEYVQNTVDSVICLQVSCRQWFCLNQLLQKLRYFQARIRMVAVFSSLDQDLTRIRILIEFCLSI